VPNDPPEEVDRFHDPLPPGALVRLGTVRFRQKALRGIALSPDGKFLASADLTLEGVGLWDVATGLKTRRLPAPPIPSCLAFAADGKTLAVGGHQALWCYQLPGGTNVSRISGKFQTLSAVALSADGKVAAGVSDDQRVRVWDVDAEKELARFDVPRANLRSQVALSPDGRTAARATQAVDRQTGRTFASLRVWDVATGKERWQARGSITGALAFSPDGKTLAWWGHEHRVGLWAAAGGKAVGHFPHDRAALLRFSPDGKTLAAGNSTRSVRLWDLARREGKTLFPAGPEWEITSLVLLPAGKVRAAWVEGDKMFVREGPSGKALTPLLGHCRGVEAVAFSPDGKALLSAGPGSVRRWETATGKELSRFRPKLPLVGDMAPVPGGKYLIWTRGGRLCLVDAGSRKELCVLPRLACRPGTVSVSGDGKRVAAASWTKPTVRVWDVVTGKERHRLTPPADPVTGAAGVVERTALSPDGRTLVCTRSFQRRGGDYFRLCAWDLTTGKEKFAYRAELTACCQVGFSPDGRTLAVADYEGVRLLDVAGGAEIRRLRGGEGVDRPFPVLPTAAPVFSPDSKSLALAAMRRKPDDPLHRFDYPIYLLEVATGGVRARFEGHRDWVTSLAFSPDGKSLASGSRDTTALVWDLTCSGRRTGKDLEGLWADLGGADAAKAYQAIWSLAADPGRAVPFLKARLRPAPAPPRVEIGTLIADLEHQHFKAREKASRCLEGLGAAARPALLRVLKENPSAEVAGRVRAILTKLDQAARAGAPPRLSRALEALEHAGSREARRVLRALAAGDPADPFTQEAGAALKRLGG
jgi:WD40 repeat protein